MADAFQGFQQPESFGSDYNAQVALIKSILSTVRTSTLVQVVACTNAGAVSAVGTVDVMPIVNQLDGYGSMVPHGVIYSCPYARLQGGTNAIIIDPQPGDIGIAIFSDRDISKVISTKKQANPGSNRKFDMADGCYFGGFLNAAPVQYIEFSTAGIKIFSPVDIVIQATGNINATAGGDIAATATGNISATATGNMTAHAGGNVALTTDGNITATANGSASVTAPTATVTASGGLALVANTTVTGNLIVSGVITAAGITIT